MARNILFTYVPNSDVSNFINDHLNNTTDIYSKRIAFLGETGLIMTHGELFANNLLSDNYEMSELINSSLNLLPGDSYEIALGKLEKAIIDNEKVATNALIYLDENKLDSSVISAVGLSNDYNDLDNLPDIPSFDNVPTTEYVDTSINNLKDYVDSSINTLKDYIDSSLSLSSEYVMSSSTNEELHLLPNDSFETAFSKLEKSIIDNELVLSKSILYLDKTKLDSSVISAVGLSNDYNDLDNLPIIPSFDDVPTTEYIDTSINNLKDYVDSSLVLSSEYVMSSSINDDLQLLPGDRFETAFSKLEKAIIDNENVITNSLIYLDENKLDSSVISAVGLSNDYNDLDNLPIIPSFDNVPTTEYVDTSILNLKNYVDSSLSLSSEYVMSSSTNEELHLLPGDRFETAFSKLEKSIIDNEKVTTNTLIYLNETKLDSSVISAVGLSNDYNDLDNLPVIPSFDNVPTTEYVDTSILNLKNYVDSSLSLSSNYVISSSTGLDLVLQPNDRYEIAFGKLEKVITDNKQAIDTSFNNLVSDTNFVVNRFVNWGKIENIENLTSTLTIDAYKIYKLGTVTQNVTITLDTTTEIPGYSAEYTIIFDASSGCNITLPVDCLYANGITPRYVTGRTYEMNIMNNLVVITSFYKGTE